MTRATRTLLVGAALTGFLAGTSVAQATGGDKPKPESGKKATKMAKEKHACKGKNSCRGLGGGATRGKNECKGKGECRTDGKPVVKEKTKA